jgi:sarcosine oxidase subunit beta
LVAGGAWALPLLRRLGISVPLRPIRIQVAIFPRPLELSGIHPICIDGIRSLWMRPEGPGWRSTLGGVAQRSVIEDPDMLDEGVDGEYVPMVRAGLAQRMPAMADAPMRGGWAGVVTYSADGKPIIDRHPLIEGLYIFTADNGSSFKTAPAIGRVFAEWIAGGKPSLLDPRPFRLSRFEENDPLVGENEYGDRDYDYTRAQALMVG